LEWGRRKMKGRIKRKKEKKCKKWKRWNIRKSEVGKRRKGNQGNFESYWMNENVTTWMKHCSWIILKAKIHLFISMGEMWSYEWKLSCHMEFSTQNNRITMYEQNIDNKRNLSYM
jgi:hypothetical protein